MRSWELHHLAGLWRDVTFLSNPVCYMAHISIPSPDRIDVGSLNRCDARPCWTPSDHRKRWWVPGITPKIDPFIIDIGVDMYSAIQTTMRSEMIKPSQCLWNLDFTRCTAETTSILPSNDHYLIIENGNRIKKSKFRLPEDAPIESDSFVRHINGGQEFRNTPDWDTGTPCFYVKFTDVASA